MNTKYKSLTPLAILLATYNSSSFLREQLDSLFYQDNLDWTLFIHDDGSKDNTLDIIKEYQLKYQNIVVIEDGIIRLGAQKNFMHLLNSVEANYYMFCDHDDVWLPFKVNITITQLMNMEQQFENRSIVVHTDLTIVDKQLQLIDKSMWHYSKIRPSLLKRPNYAPVSCYLTGCTVAINNKAKKDLLGDFLFDWILHDQWLGLQAVYQNAIISSISTPTILYRLHGNNETGIPKRNLKAYISRCVAVSDFTKGFRNLKPYLDTYNYGTSLKFLFYKMLYTIKRNFKE